MPGEGKRSLQLILNCMMFQGENTEKSHYLDPVGMQSPRPGAYPYYQIR